MMSPELLELDRALQNLSLAEQQWLLERLTQQIRDRIQSTSQFVGLSSLEKQLEDLASDPDIQKEIKAIEGEFAIAEMDGLENE
ncbi:MAG: hypothetical protein J7647_30485 [Cyanobacteria bacterium SBLK]|nr:hypothetical protein [Cyanobacteria bacterium SBLK]